MKKILTLAIISSIIFAQTLIAEEPPKPTNGSHNQAKIKQFLDKQRLTPDPDFPYLIHLFSQGEVTKNKYGLRIAENATQLRADTMGQLFYYKLLEESMRVPHWHANAIEVGTVLTGKMRVTIWDGVGKKQVFTVDPDNTWMIPQGALHSLENVGKNELTFILAYNAPITADVQFEQAWASLPDAILASSVGLTAEEIETIKKGDVGRLSGFDPGAEPESANLHSPFSSDFATIEPVYQSNLGSIKRVDSTNNTRMNEMAFQQTILKPGTLRLPHWYTAGDTFLFLASGEAFFTMMNYDGKAYNVMLKPGDLIFMPVGTFHSFLNTGKSDLLVYEVFNAAKNIQEISLLEGAKNLNMGAVQGALGLSRTTVQRVLNQKPLRYMTAF